MGTKSHTVLGEWAPGGTLKGIPTLRAFTWLHWKVDVSFDGLCISPTTWAPPEPYFNPLWFSCLYPFTCFVFLLCLLQLCPSVCIHLGTILFVSPPHAEYLAGSQGGEFHVISPSRKWRHFFHTDPGCNVHVLPSLPLEWGDQLSWFSGHTRHLVLKWKALRIELSCHGRWNTFPIPFWSELSARVCLQHYKLEEYRVTGSLGLQDSGNSGPVSSLYRLVHLLHMLINIILFCMCHDVKRIV